MKRKKLPIILTDDEITRLLDAPDLSTAKGIRDKAMLNLILATGMWVTELISLRTEDVFTDLRCVRSNETIIPIKDEVVSDLQAYETVRGDYANPSIDTFFVNFNKGNTGQPLTRQGAWKIIKTYQEKVLINKQISPEMLRQSFAVRFLEHGGNLEELQKILGHKDIKSTLRLKA